jgi:superfamily II DNA or RNA helicase
MITITIKNCNVCELSGPAKFTNRLYNIFRIKHPDAWHIRIYSRANNWDGYVKYISDYGQFRIGLLNKVYQECIKTGQKVKIIDQRPKLGITPEVPNQLGDKLLREVQKKALEKILFNKVGNIPFIICASDLAVNFGKTLIFCGLHQAFKRKLKTVLLLNSSDLFNQFKTEIPQLLPGEDIAFIQGSKCNNWGNFNVCMVQSLSANIRKYQKFLSEVDMVLIDEADVIDNKTYKTVIQHLYNSRIRVGLSGTIYMSQLKKKLVHNMNIMSFIGDKVNEVKLVEMMEKGYSTPIVCKMIYAPFKYSGNDDYPTEYKKVITDNVKAYELSLRRTKFNLRYNRLPMLIVCKFIDHCEKLYKYYTKHLGDEYTIQYVHHNTKGRDEILRQFRNGEIDILIATTIISRGQNFPELKYLQNTASMDSNEKSLQILGRLARTHMSKKKAYLDDLVFPGNYLKRHGNHRKNYYLKEKLKVIKIENP